VFQNRYGKLNYCPSCGVDTKWYRVKGRKAYACVHCRYQLHPLAQTIFRKSETSLWNWFYAIYLVSVAKNGISAKELERHLGVTYKTAWRMLNQIKKLMAEELELNGIVEADETYVGGRRRQSDMHDNKTPIAGLAEKRGRVKAIVLDGKASEARVMPFVKHNVRPMSVLHTDKSKIYQNAKRDSYKHRSVDHGIGSYVKNGVHTNNIESFWSQLKRSFDGTYHCVSPKYMQLYLDEFVFRFNHRYEPVCPVLLERASKLA
jgi:transposase